MEQVPAVPGYEVLARLGAGATSTVWRARRRADGLVVALKVLTPAGGDVEAGLREAGLLARLRHPHVVHLYDVLPLHDPVTGRPAAVALATQLAGGGSLGQLLSRRRLLTPGELVTVLHPVASALADLHSRGVVHGDLSPGNVLFLRDGMPVVGDLGAARIVGQTAGERQGTGASEGMVAPEVVEGFPATPESDVYQLGALAWRALTGEPPGPTYARRTLEEAAPGLPVGVVELVERCVAPEPEDRPDAEEVAVDLLSVATPAPVEVAPDADPALALTERLRQEALDDLPPPGGARGGGARGGGARARGSHRPQRNVTRERGTEPAGRRGGRALLAGAAVLAALLLAVGAGVVTGLVDTSDLGRPWRVLAQPEAAAAQGTGEAGEPAAGDGVEGAEPVAGTGAEGAETAVDTRVAGAATEQEELRSLLQGLVDGRGAAWEQRDGSLLAGVMAPGSPALEAELAQLDELREQGISYGDVTFRVEAVEELGRQDDRMTVLLTVSRAPLRAIDSTGTERLAEGTRTDTLTVHLVKAADEPQWLLWSWGT
ncbi:serine/threonine-protein kinase [Ornithinimicrobium tianjinense]|uniref:non-specific serine/threonine protein kinase n=1 Tax=Ornithinimicrobium tianjinense TaxID=1195761 RepID=A0A917BJ25_9MICO|nr:serine/threonine-protein kinase [Ornithinimicrobium tianjinense]GGF44950.1 hypothetical protein GCM10011366_10820 [Ornithinimicrobium tianjinense]